MFDIGWSELLVVGVVSLIVVGPKDLPGMFRTVGRFTGKARSMAREFQSAMNDAADSAGVGDVANDLKSMTSRKGLGLDKLDDVAKKFEDWSPTESAAAKAKKGSETAKLAEKRAETSQKAQGGATKKAQESKAKVEAPAKAEKPVGKPAPKKKAAPKKAAPKKAAAKTSGKSKQAAKASEPVAATQTTGKTT